MKALFLLLALFLFSIILHAQDQQKLLEHAYKTKSKKELKQFFDNWHKEIPPISDSEFAKLNDLQKEVYKVFEAFYKEWNVGWINGTFIVINPAIIIYLMDSITVTHQDSLVSIRKLILSSEDTLNKNTYLKEFNKKGITPDIDSAFSCNLNLSSKLLDSINYFKPRIHYFDDIPLFLTKNYESIIDTFLGVPPDYNIDDTLTKLYRKHINGFYPDKVNGIYKRKQDFLNNFINVDHTHKLNKWIITNYPVVYSIAFNKNLTKAEVEFGSDFERFSGVLKKEKGIWTFEGGKFEWIK